MNSGRTSRTRIRNVLTLSDIFINLKLNDETRRARLHSSALHWSIVTITRRTCNFVWVNNFETDLSTCASDCLSISMSTGMDQLGRLSVRSSWWFLRRRKKVRYGEVLYASFWGHLYRKTNHQCRCLNPTYGLWPGRKNSNSVNILSITEYVRLSAGH